MAIAQMDWDAIHQETPAGSGAKINNGLILIVPACLELPRLVAFRRHFLPAQVSALLWSTDGTGSDKHQGKGVFDPIFG